MLEIGCGNLRADRLFIEHLGAGDYDGIDISPTSCWPHRARWAEIGLQDELPHLTLVRDLTLDLLPAGHFDVVPRTACSRTPRSRSSRSAWRTQAG